MCSIEISPISGWCAVQCEPRSVYVCIIMSRRVTIRRMTWSLNHFVSYKKNILTCNGDQLFEKFSTFCTKKTAWTILARDRIYYSDQKVRWSWHLKLPGFKNLILIIVVRCTMNSFRRAKLSTKNIIWMLCVVCVRLFVWNENEIDLKE